MLTKQLFKKLFKLSDVDDSGDWSLEEYVKKFSVNLSGFLKKMPKSR